MQSHTIGAASLVDARQPPQQVGTGGVAQVVVAQFAARQQLVHQPQAGRRAVAHRHGHRAIQFHHRRRSQAQQHVVEPDDLRPVGLRRAGRLGMHGDDCRLQGIGPEVAAGQGAAHQHRTLGDQSPVPGAAVLVLQPHQLAGRIGTRGAARIVQQHQRQQAHHLGVGQQFQQQPAEADGLGAKIGPGQRRPRRSRIALVEHQVDHPQHAVEPCRQFLALRHAVGNPRIADPCLCTHDTLGDGGGRGEEGPRDLLGGQVADFAQGQRHARIGRQRRVAAGEDQPQTIVFHLVELRFMRLALQLLGQQPQRGIEPCPPAQGIDGLEAPGGHQPGARIARYAVARPLL